MTSDVATDPAVPVPPPSPDRLALARSIVSWALAAELAVLVATGAWLFLDYSPVDGGRHLGFGSGTVRVVHRVDARLLIWTAMAVAVLFVISATSRRKRWASGGLGVGLWLAALVASTTGHLLPWDQLALWAVSVGDGFEGYRWLSDDRVRFVLVGSTEISPDTLRRWLYVHVAAAAVVAVLLAVTWRAVARTRREHRGATAGLAA